MKDDLHEIFRLATNHFFKKFRDKGGTQRRLAMKLGVTQSYISSVLSGSRTASLELQSQIADLLYGPYEEFLTIGRRIKNGLDPEMIDSTKDYDNSVEALIARLSHYVIDHQRIEGELVSRKNFYETVIENLQSGVMVNDREDTVIYANSYMSRIISLPVDDIVGTNTLKESEKYPERQLNNFVDVYKKARETLEPVFYENLPVVSSGARDIVITGWIVPIVKNRVFDGMIITVRDMTRLQHLNQTLLATLEYIPYPVGVALQDHEKAPVTSYHMNKAALKLFGIEPYGLTQEAIRASMQKTAELLENGDEWLAQTARNFKGVEHSTMVINFKDGRKYTWDSRALRDAEGNYCGRYVTTKEILRKRRRGDKMELVKG